MVKLMLRRHLIQSHDDLNQQKNHKTEEEFRGSDAPVLVFEINADHGRSVNGLFYFAGGVFV